LGTVFYYYIIFMKRYLNLKLLLIQLLVVVLAFFSCKQNFKADLSGIKTFDVNINRYEEALFGQDLNDSILQQLQKEYPLFLGDLPLNEKQKEQLFDYVNDPFLETLYEESHLKFPELNKETKELAMAFRYIKYYLPAFEAPQIYTYISGNQDEIFFQDSIVLISIDRYLGPDTESYNRIGIPKYLQAKMTPEYISRDVLFAIARQYIAEPSPDDALLAHMIYHGKLTYFVKSMYPEINDQILLAQTEYHLKWLKENKENLWRFIIENEVLYKSDYESYKKFISDAPFTAPLGDNSASRIGVWIGYKIVYAYMKNNEMSLSEMIEAKGDQVFLNKSKFKP
jgi:hypothetical protein